MIEEQSIPVIIGDGLRWLSPSEHERHRSEWQSRIPSLNGRDSGTRGLGIYGYPVADGENSNMFLAEVHTGPEGGSRRWQYWRENGDGVWRLAHEGPASFHEIHFKGLPPRMPLSGLLRYVP